jgi:predicted flap endonuclease-1-like 5' DNA nuclease
MNGLILLVVIVLAIGVVVAWRVGISQGRREASAGTRGALRPADVAPPPAEPAAAVTPAAAVAPAPASDASTGELARLVRSSEGEAAALRQRLHDATTELEAARAEAARYREIVIDLENDAPPLLLDGPGAPDDLKLIVGVGPVLERMLHKLGITTYRQIARWSERDIDEFDARLPEFPGRIRRDAWVTQARALHQSKFGEALPMRER